MNWIIYHVVSGGAFFTGMGLLLVSAMLGMTNKRWCRRLASLACLTGILLITVSATAVNYFFYVTLGVVSLLWLIFLNAKTASFHLRRSRIFGLLLTAICISGMAFEVPYHVMPTIAPTKADTVVIFGDSVTAGVGEESETWPQILEREKSVRIEDHSRPAARTATVLKLVNETSLPDGIVILEIGGNDVLSSTPVAEFRRDLKATLEQLASPSRQIIMFELPLPPLSNSYGRVQREVANQYDVKLIPRRVFARVLAAENATLDSIHLSQDGHQLMAETVWQVIEPAMPEE